MPAVRRQSPDRIPVLLALAALIGPAYASDADVLSTLAIELGERPRFATPDPRRVALGHKLFYDPILSGNRNISCATCHHPAFGTGDGVSLSLGEGGIGLGPDRKPDPNNPPEQRIPRNAQSLFNLGADTVTTFFHDGRLEADLAHPDGIRTPLGEDMLSGFDSALSAQSMFPVLSPDEMAGHYAENEIALAVRQGRITGPDGAWERVTRRVTEIPEYRAALDVIYGLDAAVDFTDIANLIADFIAVEWRADDSPFDRALLNHSPLNPAAMRGLNLFYGAANCATCHSGWLQSDQSFHAIGVPQFGPGKAARFESHQRDEGRLRVTGADTDRFRFRTPSLRNVELSAPYGHTGAFATLERAIEHHIKVPDSIASYDPSEAVLPRFDGAASDWVTWNDARERSEIAERVTMQAVALSGAEVSDLVAFLRSLTDNSWRERGLGVPASVPSGLAVDQ